MYKRFGGRCARCGSTHIQAHHIVRRGKKVLRWDIKNGIALCKKCHNWMDTLEGTRWSYKQVDYEYLLGNDITLAEYIAQNGITRAEFRERAKNALKEYLDDKEG